jgi:hypothetical protein
MEDKKTIIHLHLFSEMDEDGDILPVEVELTEEDVAILDTAIFNKLDLLPFGKIWYNKDDIIKFVEIS